MQEDAYSVLPDTSSLTRPALTAQSRTAQLAQPAILAMPAMLELTSTPQLRLAVHAQMDAPTALIQLHAIEEDALLDIGKMPTL